MTNQALAALADATATLKRTTDWRRDTSLSAHGAEAIEGHGEWRWLVVRFEVQDDPDHHGFDGTAIHVATNRVLHLTRELAARAWDHGATMLTAEPSERSGRIPAALYESPGVPDPKGRVRQIVREEREQGR